MSKDSFKRKNTINLHHLFTQIRLSSKGFFLKISSRYYFKEITNLAKQTVHHNLLADLLMDMPDSINNLETGHCPEAPSL